MKHVLLSALLIATTMTAAEVRPAHAVAAEGGDWPAYYQANWYGPGGGSCHINVSIPGVGNFQQEAPEIETVYDCYFLAWMMNYWTSY